MTPRNAWAETLEAAGAAARRALDGGVSDKADRQMLVARWADLSKGRKGPFPLDWPSAQGMAKAFVLALGVFVGGGERADFARSLHALAADLLDMLEAERRAQFERSCRVVGSD